MSFEKVEKPVLLKVAEFYGVEVAENARPKTIITALEADGVTWDDAVKQVPELAEVAPAVQEEVATEQAENRAANADTLIRMHRDNRSFQIRGYQFTKEAPFALMTPEDAEWVTENVDGFRYATPKEVTEFYG